MNLEEVKSIIFLLFHHWDDCEELWTILCYMYMLLNICVYWCVKNGSRKKNMEWEIRDPWCHISLFMSNKHWFITPATATHNRGWIATITSLGVRRGYSESWNKISSINTRIAISRNQEPPWEHYFTLQVSQRDFTQML